MKKQSVPKWLSEAISIFTAILQKEPDRTLIKETARVGFYAFLARRYVRRSVPVFYKLRAGEQLTRGDVRTLMQAVAFSSYNIAQNIRLALIKFDELHQAQETYAAKRTAESSDFVSSLKDLAGEVQSKMPPEKLINDLLGGHLTDRLSAWRLSNPGAPIGDFLRQQKGATS
jgi:hypothetical protein